jgi:hypothetical protein
MRKRARFLLRISRDEDNPGDEVFMTEAIYALNGLGEIIALIIALLIILRSKNPRRTLRRQDIGMVISAIGKGLEARKSRSNGP